MVEFEKVLATAVEQKKILIVEGKVDFETADADVIDCAKWKVLDIRRYVAFYNRQRPCFAIGYDTPDNYCKRFYRGELEKKDTFSKRILTEEPKFAQKRKDTEK